MKSKQQHKAGKGEEIRSIKRMCAMCCMCEAHTMKLMKVTVAKIHYFFSIPVDVVVVVVMIWQCLQMGDIYPCESWVSSKNYIFHRRSILTFSILYKKFIQTRHAANFYFVCCQIIDIHVKKN